MRTIDRIKIAQGYVELRRDQLDRARARAADANMEMMRATAPIIDRVSACRRITNRPPKLEPVTRITLDEIERVVRCYYPSDGGRPILMAFEMIDMPIEEVVAIVEREHIKRRQIEDDRIERGLAEMSVKLNSMASSRG